MNAINVMRITRKKQGHYVIDVYAEDGTTLITTVGAAKGSPVAQAIRLVDRLVMLSDKLAGYNQ